MLYFPAFETLFSLPFFISFFFFWKIYFILRFGASTKLIDKKSIVKLKVKNLTRILTANSLVLLIIPLYLYIISYYSLLRGCEGTYFNKHLYFSESIFCYFILLLIFSFITWWWLAAAIKHLRLTESSLDYFLALLHLFFYLPVTLFANTMLTFFFFLEFSSALILWSFSSLQALTQKLTKNTKQSDLYFFFNLLFFHFWASFFSSLLILYSIIVLYFLYGTTEWSCLELLIVNQPYNFASCLSLWLALICFVLGFFIKLGVGPFFAYKLEIYQGLPLYSLLFYSLIFFFFFISLFFIVFNYYFTSVLNILKPFLILVVGSFFLCFSFFLFNNVMFRHFFALSSILTALNLISISL